MRVLVIGGGGREHTLCWKISQNPEVEDIFCIPGNAGIEQVAHCENIPFEKDFSSLIEFAKENRIDFTVVGPEAPLVSGIVNVFEEEGLRIFGPTREATRLEGSKVYAKNFMKKYGIPTAEFKTFSDLNKALSYIDKQKEPPVVKADGLAGGKGSFVTRSKEEAFEACRQIMQQRVFGSAGDKIVVEERLKGSEISFFVITDGKTVKPLVSSRDHKPLYDGNRGPNTGGMGAYSPAPLKPYLFKKIMKKIVIPTLRGLQKEKVAYKGVLYFGLMIQAEEPFVLEYNCRFGDPETQVTLPRLYNDIMDVFQAVYLENLGGINLKWRSQAATCVVLASKGYPGAYEKEKVIEGLDQIARMKNVFAFCAGVKKQNGQLVTNGGRVIGVTGMGKNLRESAKTAYRGVEKIRFEGMHYRKDIGCEG
ncbi:phosphoribosylamine--glycine ligase [Candidatus Aerophobetes bacterium]|uniref:Phosphoribosylamine--glycine ligase n=1 Tax=Aerophobetes bacterium TaxID=2030807 RepID=A0A662DAF7_UNCAE|nr:MAG: phosphoribosylamine--glycine ligase [Candidatus Aerophobetes bacterium]